jgi:DNA repair protein RadC
MKYQYQRLRETSPQYSQIPIFDTTTTAAPSGVKSRKRKVEKTLAQIRRLHDELNTELIAKPTERPSIHSPSDAFDILQPFLGPLDHEELWVMGLDTRNRVMSLVKLYQGSVNSSQVRVGELFRQAIIDNSPAIILAHNHPSGDPAPSPDDIAVTRAIVEAGKLLDISVLDHLVVVASGYVSLKERGLGFGG